MRLGNTVAVCRKCYIHPAIFAGFSAGTLRTSLTCLVRIDSNAAASRAAETALLNYLRRDAEAA